MIEILSDAMIFYIRISEEKKKCIHHFPLKSKELHLSVVNEVKAQSQSKSFEEIEHLLNSFEINLIRRARNKIKKFRKSSDPVMYSGATGFETLVGWLFLEDPKRLSKIFEHLECK